MGAYDHVYHGGKVVDKFTDSQLTKAEKKLGYELTIIQGSYNSGVAASAGTHDGGGAVDLSPYDWKRKCRVLRKLGFAAWHRPTLPGVWNEHIHAIQYDNAKLSSGAVSQKYQYYNHTDGLAGHGWDSQWRPDPIPHFKFKAGSKWPKPWGRRVNRARVNRMLKNPGKYQGKTAMRQSRTVVRHLRKHTKFTVDGFENYPAASLRRALRHYQQSQGWHGAGADGLLGKETAKRLGIKSRWARLPGWGKHDRIQKMTHKS